MAGNPSENQYNQPAPARGAHPPHLFTNQMPRPRDEADVQYQMLIQRQADQIRHLREQNMEYASKINENDIVMKKLQEDRELFREVARFYVGVCYDHWDLIKELKAKIEKLTDGAPEVIATTTTTKTTKTTKATTPQEPVSSTTTSELEKALRAPVAPPPNAPEVDDDLQVLPTPEKKTFAQIAYEWSLKDYGNIHAYESHEFLFNPNGTQLVPQPVKKVTNYFAFFTTVLTTEESLTGDYKYRNNKRNMWNEISDQEKDEWRVKFNRIMEIQTEQRNLGWTVFKKCPDRKRAPILEKRPLFDPKKVKQEPLD